MLNRFSDVDALVIIDLDTVYFFNSAHDFLLKLGRKLSFATCPRWSM
jgi:hypothetical protein